MVCQSVLNWGWQACCLGVLSEEGPEFVTSCLAGEEPVAECHRLVSIVPKSRLTAETNVMDIYAAVRNMPIATTAQCRRFTRHRPNLSAAAAVARSAPLPAHDTHRMREG
jgi:hypothetical protein